MSIERCVPNTMYSALGLTNGPNAYDAPSVAYPASGNYTQSGDTTFATEASTTAVTYRYAYLYGFSAKQAATWTSAALWVKYDLITQGDDAATQWNSNADISYCYDFNSGTYTGTWVSIDSATGDFGTGIVESGAIALTLGSLVNSTFAIRIAANGHVKTGVTPDWILGSLASVRLYHAFIDGVYTSFDITSLNSNSYCNIGSTYNIAGVGLTGSTAVTINGVSASFSVTNSTTISVTIPQMSSYGAVVVAVTNGTTLTMTGYINTPTVTINSPSSGGSVFNSSTTSCSATLTNLANTTINWTCTAGSFSPTSTSSGGSTTWTAPATCSNPTTVTITATAAGNGSTVASITRSVYYYPTVTSFTSSPAANSTVVNGTIAYLTWATSNATSTSTNFGSTSTAWTALSVGSVNSNTVTTYTITPVNAAGSGSTSSISINAIAPPSLTNNGPVVLNTNVTLTPTFGSGIAATVAPGTWGTWASGTGQAISLPCNRGYTLTQTGIGTAYTVAQAKLPTTPAASISMSQARQIIEGPSSTNSISMNATLIRNLSGTQNNATVSFSNLSNKYLSTVYIF